MRQVGLALIQNRLPVFLYRLNDRRIVATEQKIEQRGFLNLLQDSDLGRIHPRQFDSKAGLLERIRQDFDD